MNTLTPAQLAALIRFAKAHGRCWKAPLRHAWETGVYPSDQDTPSLQQVRNNLGPSWLVRFRLPRAAGWNGK